MWRMLQADQPDDYVIATGYSISLEQFVSLAFESFGLDWRKYVDLNVNLFRPTDLMFSLANPQKAAQKLGWKAISNVTDVIGLMAAG